MLLRAVALAASLLAAGCAPAGTGSPAPAPSSHAARQLPNDIRWVRTSAEYRALARQAYAVAADRLPVLTRGFTFGNTFFILPNPMYGSWEHLH